MWRDDRLFRDIGVVIEMCEKGVREKIPKKR